MKQYTTIQGDTWDLIAFKILGSEYYLDRLMSANPKHMNTAVFEAGITLNIPAITVPISNKLPPWKR
ncbi:MAG: tail protein X [Sporomusa sp.]